jgi:O-antigen ligase
MAMTEEAATPDSPHGDQRGKSLSQRATELVCKNRYLYASLTLIAWQPMPGSYQLPILILSILGIHGLATQNITLDQPINRRFSLILLCLLIPSALSLPASHDQWATSQELFSGVIAWIVGLSVIKGFSRPNSHRWMQKAILWTLAAWILIGLLQMINLVPTAQGFFHAGHPITSMFKTAPRFGVVTTSLLAVALWRPLQERSISGCWLLLAAGITAALTGQRNNVLIFALGFTALATQLPKQVRFGLTLVIVGGLTLALMASPEIQLRSEQMGASIHSALTALGNTKAAHPSHQWLNIFNAFSSERGYIFDASWQMFKVNPIFGIGADAFKSAYPHFASLADSKRFADPPQPHNVYLGILAQTGLIGLAGLLASIGIGYAWYRNCKSPEKKKQALPYGISLAIMLCPITTQTELTRSFYFCIILLLLGGFLSALFESEHNRIQAPKVLASQTTNPFHESAQEP